MNDTRLAQAEELLDDARELLIEIVDEQPDSPRDVNQIDAARLFINAASKHIQQASGEPA